jgi:hypothetical protein
MDRLQVRGIPNQIDRSFLAFLSGSNQSHLLAALRYLGLISPTGKHTERLDALVKSAGAEHASCLRKVLKDSYPFLFSGFDLGRATPQEIEDKFSEAGASGDTLRKCIAFFLSAAKAAEMQTSPFITRMRRRRRSPAIAIERDRKLIEGERSSKPHGQHISDPGFGIANCAELLVEKFPQFDPTWSDETKATWFEAFQKLLKKVGN